MGDMIEGFKVLKEESQKKKLSNYESSIKILKDNNIEFKILSEHSRHLRVGDFDFWPSTGKFYNQKTQQKGRGVFKLIKFFKIKKEK